MYTRTQNALKNNFNELEFHTLLLNCGPVPLRYIEDIVDNYIAENKKYYPKG